MLLIPYYALSKSWSGTGFALSNGYVVTNFHVVDGADSIVIHETENSASYVAHVVNFDKKMTLQFFMFLTIPFLVLDKYLIPSELLY